MKVLVLGLGNDLFRDDGVGLYAVRALKAELEGGASTEAEPQIHALESPLSGPGPAILDLLIGYDRAIIIDAVKTEEGSPGEIYEFELDPEALGVVEPAPSLHYAGLPEAIALALARGLELDLPKELKIFAVEAEDLSLGEGLTESVARALPALLAKVREEIDRSGMRSEASSRVSQIQI